MKNHFFFGYAGNKRQEVDNIYSYFKILNNITHIIEPFCGTGALSYFISVNEPKKYKYILNDNNKKLIEFYNIAKDPEALDNLITHLKSYMDLIRSKPSIKEQKEEYLKIIKNDTIEGYIIANKIYSIRAGMYPSDANRLKSMLDSTYFDKLKICPMVKFLQDEDITFTNECGIECFSKYKDDANSFIFLDPPYLNLCNDFYANSDINIYEYLYKNSINECNSKILLCINDIWINRLLFSKDIKDIYNKKYETSKKFVQHLIICNY